MGKNKKKVIIILLIIVSMITIFFALKVFINKEEKPDIKLKNINKSFAIMISEDGSNYDEYEGEEWPRGYTFKKAKCVDNNGNEVEEIVTYDEETNKITLKSKKTVYCTIYFDYKGTGEKELPYKIRYIEDLVKLSEEVNNGETYIGKYFELVKDLDFNKESDYQDYQSKDYGDINGNGTDDELKTELTTGSGWKPIGKDTISNYTKYFSGIFDGKDKTINNLYIKEEKVAGQSVGLFGNVVNGIIKNLKLNGKISTSINTNLGLLMGSAFDTTIENCTTKGTVTSTSGYWSTGGLIGAVYEQVIIKNSHNEATVTGGAWIGGIVGGFGNGNLTIEGSSNLGTISKVDDVSIQGIGGLVGAAIVINDTYSITIKNSENKGEVKDRPVGARVSYVGGLIGRSYVNVTIEGSNNQGAISSEGATATTSYVGGLIGTDNDINQTITINNSYNTGAISSNVTQHTLEGGIMGYSIGNLNINKSYNEGNIINNRTTFDVYDMSLGGILGQSAWNSAGSKIITNSYNNAQLKNGNRIAGIIGYQWGNGIVIIDKCYNGPKGEMISNISNSIVGGIIGFSRGEHKTYILNSYNIGKMSSVSPTGGIVASADNNAYIYIINTYNAGIIDNTDDSFGILAAHSSTNAYLNNVYNIGNLMGKTKYGLGYKDETSSATVINGYYNQTITNTNSIIGTLMNINDIKSQTFVDTLNNNLKSINLENINGILKDYTLNRWELGESGYPILVDSKIEDLSGNGHDAINYGIRKDATGITTSINSTLGYINTQVKNHIFTNGLTFITRVKINNFASGMAIMGNWEGQTGGGLYYRNTKVFCLDMYELKPTTLCSTDTYNENAWYTLIGTYNNGILKLYIINNGKITKYSLETTGTFTISNNAPITIGVDPDMNGNFVGGHNYGMFTVSEALIFDRELSEEEIRENYSNELNLKNKDKLLLWYKF